MNVILENQFHEIIESELSRLNWSRSDLAREMGVSRSIVTDYLNGRRKPGIDVMEKFFEALNLSPSISVQRKEVSAV